jgi:thiol:disulfide interchange protein DsbD
MTAPLRLATLLLLFVAAPCLAIDEDDLLPVDEAFALTARATGADAIALDWKIADGYYLYRHRMSAVPAAGAGSAGALVLPRGKAHTDEFFGRVETFRGSVRATLAEVVAQGGASIALTVKYQGCADLGICYPPQTRTLTVALPTRGTDAPARNGGGLAALGRALVGGQGAAPALPGTQGRLAAPLPAEQAFGFEAIIGDGNTLLLRFTPAKGYYLYRDRNSFRLEGASGVSAGTPRWPKGQPYRDEHFGQVTVYFDQVDVPLPLLRKTGEAAKATLVATFQGCQDHGICYPPMTRKLALAIPAGTVSTASATPEAPMTTTAAAVPDAADTLPASPADTNATSAAGATEAARAAAQAPAMPIAPGTASATAAAADPPQAEDQRLAGELSGSTRWLALLGFFGAGLLLAFTPCVLPMIPILSGLIAGRGERIGAARAFTLSLVYVLANAVVFTVAGVVAGLVGANLQIAFQTPWVLALFAALFIALALSMFGLYELQLPASWRARLGALSDDQRGGSWAGVAAMGALSALIVGPCVAPPLAAAVLYIGQARDPVFGGAALFLLAMGMGAPLLAFGVAAGRGLPTSGPWMVAVQRVFGFVFVGMAVWMLSRVLPGAATLALYGLVALAFAAWLFAQVRPTHAQGPRWALRFAGVVFGILGAAQLLGALAGGHDPLRPLAGVVGTQQQTQGELPFRKIKSLDDLRREVSAAQAAGKPLLFDFYADWCVACKEMEKYTFPQAAVHAALDGFVLLKADVTANDAIDQALMKELGIIGPPATLYYVDGAERRDLRLFGFERAEDFVRRAQRVQP